MLPDLNLAIYVWNPNIAASLSPGSFSLAGV